MSYTRTTVQEGPISNSGPYEAIIVNHLDPYMQGTLEVELIRRTSSSNLPERSGQLMIVKYLSPFYGVTPASGLKENDDFQSTQKSYGFWAVPPDVGSRVLVIFAEGISAYGYWIGCIQDNNMNMMVPGATASTLLHTEETPEDLKDKKLPVGEYNKKLEDGAAADPQFFKKPYNKDFSEVLQVQGLLDDETRGTTTSSARREAPSMVFGMSTPGPLDKRKDHPKAKYGYDIDGIDIPYNRLGGSSFVMDDGDQNLIRATHAEDGPPVYVNKRISEEGGDETIPQNEMIRFRTRTGHQIMMHNSEDLIYIANSRGTAWIEMSSDGKIDIHAQDSISVMSDTDINFTAERDFNVEAGRNINMKASARWSDGKHFEQEKQSGRVQIESAYNTSLLVGAEHTITVGGSSHLSADDSIFSNAAKNTHLSSGSHMYHEAIDGALHTKAAQSIYRTAGSNIYDDVTGNYLLTVDGTINNRAGISILTNAVENINTTAGIDMFNKTATGSIHNTAETSIFNKTVTGEMHNIAETDIFNHSKTANINSLAEVSIFNQAKTADINSKAEGSIFSESTRNIESKSGLGTHITSGAETHIQATANFVSTGAEIHFNGPAASTAAAATDATEGVDALLPANAAKAIEAGSPQMPAKVSPLPEITLPYVLPGVTQPIPYNSIVPRAPQHEPWPHHENMNPLGFKRDQTDREAPGMLASADRFISPDTFLRNSSVAEASVRVTGSGGDLTATSIPNEEGFSGPVWTNDEGDSVRVGSEGVMDEAMAKARGFKPYVPPKIEGYDETANVYYVAAVKAGPSGGKFRHRPCEPKLIQLLDKTASICDVKVEIFSAGQMPKSEWQRTPGARASGDDRYVGSQKVATGSLRHDYGSAADIYIYDFKTGKTIVQDSPRFLQFIEEFFANGGRGVGAKNGYMGDNAMHIDIVGTDRGGGNYWLSSPAVKSAYLRGVKRRTSPIRSAYYHIYSK